MVCDSASVFLWVFQGSFCLFAIRSGLGWSQELRNNQTKCFLAWITPFLKQSLLWDFTLMCFQEIRKCINVLQNIDWLRCWYHSWTKLLMIFLSCLVFEGRWYSCWVTDRELWEKLLIMILCVCYTGEPVKVDLGGREKSVSHEVGVLILNPPPAKGLRTDRDLASSHLISSLYSGSLACRIPWTEEPGGLYSPWGCKE